MNLMEFYGIDSLSDMNSNKSIPYSCLRKTFLNNTQYWGRAFKLLIKSDYREFHELIKEFLMELKKTNTSCYHYLY